MNLEPWRAAGETIHVHALAALGALLLGGWVLLASTKGSPLHRALGRAYLGLMLIAALTAIFIHALNPRGPFGFSPVHLLIIVTLLGVWRGWRAARRGEIMTHRRIMIRLYISALIVAGAFTLLPGRLLHGVLFGP